MLTISSFLRKLATDNYWADRIKSELNITCSSKEPGNTLDPNILRRSYFILRGMGVKLVKSCGITELFISSTMGKNCKYSPNHGFYVDHTVTLNDDIFYHPDVLDDFFDSNGYFVDRPSQTLIHEMGHAWDAAHDEPSSKEPWLSLSGWSSIPKVGLKRLIIQEPGQPVTIGEWYYNPNSGFTRFYAKRNPWDDFADSFSFYVYGMRDKLPQNKIDYFDKLLKPYQK